jgi:hypothetical protein
MRDALSSARTARRDARDEHRALSKQRDAFKRFKGRVEETPSKPMSGPGPADAARRGTSGPAPGGWTAAQSDVTGDTCRAVRRAFSELVQPHVVDADAENQSVHETIAAELSEEVALALAAEGSGNRFTPRLKRAVLEHTTQRVAESTVMTHALQRERESLDDAIEDLDAATRLLPETDEATLILASTDELVEMRDRLSSVETRLDAVAERRQETLTHVTGTGLKAGIRHDAVVEYLASDRDVTYPVLWAVGRLTAECERRRERVHDELKNGS